MAINPNKNKCPFGEKTQKFWDRRYDLFSKFDEGIEIDEAGLYSAFIVVLFLNYDIMNL